MFLPSPYVLPHFHFLQWIQSYGLNPYFAFFPFLFQLAFLPIFSFLLSYLLYYFEFEFKIPFCMLCLPFSNISETRLPFFGFQGFPLNLHHHRRFGHHLLPLPASFLALPCHNLAALLGFSLVLLLTTELCLFLEPLTILCITKLHYSAFEAENQQPLILKLDAENLPL